MKFLLLALLLSTTTYSIDGYDTSCEHQGEVKTKDFHGIRKITIELDTHNKKFFLTDQKLPYRQHSTELRYSGYYLHYPGGIQLIDTNFGEMHLGNMDLASFTGIRHNFYYISDRPKKFETFCNPEFD